MRSVIVSTRFNTKTQFNIIVADRYSTRDMKLAIFLPLSVGFVSLQPLLDFGENQSKQSRLFVF